MSQGDEAGRTEAQDPPAEPAEPDSLTLAAQFPTPTREQWRELVSAVLAKSGGTDAAADPEDALTHRTYDGIAVRPLYTAEDAPGVASGLPGHAPFVRGATTEGPTERGWDVRVRHSGADAPAIDRAVLADLENGATSLWLVVGDGALAVDDLPAALEGVYLDLAPVVLDAGAATPDAVRALLELASARDVPPAELRGSAGADPIGTLARTGAGGDLAVLAEIADLLRDHPDVRVATVDASVYHDAGASDAQEIGIATAVGVAYLRALAEAGLVVDEALERLEFRLAVTADQFASIAKLRAARRVWDRVAELSGAGDGRAGQHQHAVTSAAMLTKRDPWVNMLRGTVACFAAAVGGAEAVTVAPFDAAIGVSDDFARRIARNTQSVLHDEASLGRVIDAAGGSWFVESLTDALAEGAWTVFTDIERAGGALARLTDGGLSELLSGTAARRAEDIAHRRAPITGVSEFAFVDEEPVERPPLPVADGAGLLAPVRWAERFEELRDRADAAPERPAVFLAGLGSLASTSARTGFATNLFSAGGLACPSAAGEVDEVVAAFRESGTTVACLCATDKGYDEHGAQAATALREAGAGRVLLAGRADVDGVDGTLYAGCDALAVLHDVFDALEVK